MKFSNIVHPTDFSETSENAFRYACELAKKYEANLYLVHVYDKPVYTVARNGGIGLQVDSEATNKLREEIKAEIRKFADKPYAQDIKTKLFIDLVADVPVWKFHEGLDPKAHADLVVMGTQGATGIVHGGLVGTNAERVIRHSPLPVLSIHKDTSYTPIKKILFATDFQDPIEGNFDNVLKLAKIFDAEILVGVINTQANFGTSAFAQKRFDELKAKVGYDKLSLLVHNDESVEVGIRNVAIDNNVQLIAMLTHGRTGIAHLLRGSIAEDIAATLTFPLLTFKLPRA